MDEEILSIGQFARLAGLSVGALRHYDELGVLRPAEVDDSTSYRRYRGNQLETARTTARLREFELPPDEIRAAPAADDPADQRRLLTAHRARVEARTNRLHLSLHVLRR